jgi:uncharacterized protein YkwD
MNHKFFVLLLVVIALVGCSVPADNPVSNLVPSGDSAASAEPTAEPASAEPTAEPASAEPTAEPESAEPSASTDVPESAEPTANTDAPESAEPPTSNDQTPVDLAGAAATTLPSTDGYFQLQTQLVKGENKCFEGQGGAAPGSDAVLEGGAFMNFCQLVSGQKWKLVAEANGYYRLQNQIGENENLCLEGNRRADGAVLGGAAIMHPCQDVSGQFWKFVDAGNNYFRMQTMFLEAENKCLEGQGGAAPGSGAVLDGAAFMNDCQEVSGQLWQVVALSQEAAQAAPPAEVAPPEPTAAPEPTAVPEEAAAPEATAAPVAQTNAFEDRVLQLVNEERARAGCSTMLVVDPILQRAAWKHSEDMALKNYFSHTGLDGSKPTDRAKREGFTGHGAAENIAAGQQTPEDVMKSWMNSPGHRANILFCEHKTIGIGYYHFENDQEPMKFHHYWTQKFSR